MLLVSETAFVRRHPMFFIPHHYSGQNFGVFPLEYGSRSMMQFTDRLTYLLTYSILTYLLTATSRPNKSCRTLVYTNVWHADKKTTVGLHCRSKSHVRRDVIGDIVTQQANHVMTILCIHMQRAALYFGITASHRPTRLHGVCARHIHEPLNWMYIPLRWIFEVIDACRSSRSRCLHVTCMGYLYCWLTGPGAGAITYLCTAVVAWLQGSHYRTDDRWIAAYDCDICSHGKLCRPSVKFVIVDIFIRRSSNCWLMWFHETIDPRRTFSTCVQRLT